MSSLTGTTTCGVSVSTAFVDLATFSEVDAFLYGGCESCTYFVRGVNKANWYSIIPTVLRIVSGTPAFNSDFSASINRSGDYVLKLWVRATFPQIGLPLNTGNLSGATQGSGVHARYTRKLMHNLVSRATLTFNELCIQDLDSCWFDNYEEFFIPESYRVGYRNMIGDILIMTQWVDIDSASTANASNGGGGPFALGTGGAFNLPLSFWFTEDSGVALQVAALPFNDIRVNLSFRDFSELIVLDPGAGNNPRTYSDLVEVSIAAGTGVITPTTNSPTLRNVQVLAEYAVVHNDERVKMGKAPRDVLIHQIQRAPSSQANVTAQAAQTNVDLHLSHSIIALFFSYKNNTIPSDHSNYSTIPYNSQGVHARGGLDPIESALLTYENSGRYDWFSDFYSLVSPHHHAAHIPQDTGYHLISYALKTQVYDPNGSTNYSKLAHVTLTKRASLAAAQAATGLGDNPQQPGDYSIPIVVTPSAASGAGIARVPVNSRLGIDGGTGGAQQQFETNVRALNWNIARSSGGSLGLPVL